MSSVDFLSTTSRGLRPGDVANVYAMIDGALMAGAHTIIVLARRHGTSADGTYRAYVMTLLSFPSYPPFVGWTTLGRVPLRKILISGENESHV